MEINNLDSIMDYAISLADLEFKHEFEDLNKLASLCQEIAQAKINGAKSNPRIEKEFFSVIKEFYSKRGTFRSEIEVFPLAKELIIEH